MRLKTFHGPTVAAALETVRSELGADAIILATGDGGDDGPFVTAAINVTDDPAGSTNGSVADNNGAAEPATPEDARATVRQCLCFHGLPAPVLARVLNAVPDSDTAVDALAAALKATHSFAPLPFGQSDRLALVGPPGAGKTLLAAKIAARAVLAGETPTIISTDTRRAGGLEQLAAFTRILGLELATASNAAELARAIRLARAGPVLIDTAATNPLADGEIAALGRLLDAANAEAVLVMPAGGDPFEAAETAHAFAQLGARRLCPTRLDLARRYGAFLAAADTNRLTIAETGYSPFVGHGLALLDAFGFAALLMPHDTASTLPLPLAEALP